MLVGEFHGADDDIIQEEFAWCLSIAPIISTEDIVQKQEFDRSLVRKVNALIPTAQLRRFSNYHQRF